MRCERKIQRRLKRQGYDIIAKTNEGFAMDNSVMQKIIDLQTEITKRDDLIAKLEVFIMTESKKRKGLMDAFYQEFKDTDIFLKRQSKK